MQTSAIPRSRSRRGLAILDPTQLGEPVVRDRCVLMSGSARQDETAALVAAARAGDRDAFGGLHHLFAPMVHGILLGAVRPGEADDLTQDVFLLAMQRLGSLRDDAAFGAWLATIARNRARDHYRRGRRSQPLPQGLVGDSPPRAEAAEALSAILELPESYREPLILRLVEGMSGPEIAARTGLTPGSVRVNLHRGMKQLRARLGLETKS